MWEILGYILFVAISMSILCAIFVWAPTAAAARRRFDNSFLISFLIGLGVSTVLEVYTELHRFDLIAVICFSYLWSDLLFIRPLLRRRVIPPCVRVRAFTRGWWLVMIVLLVLVLVAFWVPLTWTSLRRLVIPGSLYLVTLAGFFIDMVCHPAEICANGVWYNGTLHEWSSFERFAWRGQGDKTVVELEYSKEVQTPFLSQRITVPPQNREAAKQLLEANLTNSAPEEAKA
jgi:hypothetical protein